MGKNSKREKFEYIMSLGHHEVMGTIDQTIDSFKKYKKRIQREHPEYYQIDTRLDHDCDDVAIIVIYGRREETEDEFEKREARMVESKRVAQQSIKDKDEEELERLRKKYPNRFKDE